MEINTKYSYNGYDPNSQEIINKKIELKKMFNKGQVIFRSFSLANIKNTLGKAENLIIKQMNILNVESTWKISWIDYYKNIGYSKFLLQNNELTQLSKDLKDNTITLLQYKVSKNVIVDELKQIFIDNSALEYKEYSAECSAMKRGFKRQSFINVDPEEFNNTEIIGSSFSQTEAFTDVFPPGMAGVVFTNCNLNNCNMPNDNAVVNGTHEHHKTQNDGEEWIINGGMKPKNPLCPERFDKYGLSKDPLDIPAEPVEEPIVAKAEKQKKKDDRKNRIIAVANDPEALNNLIESGGEL